MSPRALVLVLALVAAAGSGVRAQADEPLFYRVFLQDGSALVSFGEFARVADRVVVTIPVGAMDGSNLQLVSIAESLVDWTRTDEYTTAVRATRYARTLGPEHFAQLGNRVAEALHDIRLTEDPVRQLAMAEEARRNLARWPSQNFGYRAEDVARMVDLFEEVISELRIASGQKGFDLELSARTAPPPPVPMLPLPTAHESFEQAFAVATLAADPAERTSLLETLAAALREPARGGGWAATLHARVAAALAAELRVERAYADLSTRTTRLALERAARSDVRGLEALIRATLDADDRLGRRRPHEIAGLLGFLDLKLVEARLARAAREAWAARRGLFEEYRQRIRSPLEQLRQSRGWLTAIRNGVAPNAAFLDREEQRTVMARRVFELVAPPAELDASHSLYTAAFHMARRAAAALRDAVSSNSAALAQDASAAAAGALMLLEQADDELARLMTAPGVEKAPH
jgi:hypothetical protein